MACCTHNQPSDFYTEYFTNAHNPYESGTLKYYLISHPNNTKWYEKTKGFINDMIYYLEKNDTDYSFSQKKAYNLIKKWRGKWREDCRPCTFFYVWFFNTKNGSAGTVQRGFEERFSITGAVS